MIEDDTDKMDDKMDDDGDKMDDKMGVDGEDDKMDEHDDGETHGLDIEGVRGRGPFSPDATPPGDDSRVLHTLARPAA